MTLAETAPSHAAADRPRCFALVPCAGTGSRSGSTVPKQYRVVAGRPVVAHALAALRRVDRVAATLVVLAADDRQFETGVPEFTGERGWVARCGGATRAQSVANGLDELVRRGAEQRDWVLVHDAARCLIRPEWVDRLIDACIDDPVGGLLALPLADTLKSERGGRVAATLDRDGKWAAQTPQMFRLGLLRQALAAAATDVTDEAGAVEAAGHAPKLVTAPLENFKLTWPEDFDVAERLLARHAGSGAAPEEAMNPSNIDRPLFRIGEGWDTHALVAGRALVLGGVTIAHSHGLLGHSDADALCHAITDALLGAAALGDIGRHFPDTDPQFRGADSIALLAEAARRVRAAGHAIGNVDATVVAQAPRLAPYIDAMRSRLATALGLALEQVNVKAKTAERMGPVGRGESIEARAVCLLLRA